MRLIAGKLNGTNKSNFWIVSEKMDLFRTGDYAIVENLGGHDLVQIIGVLNTEEEFADKITGNKIKKNVVRLLYKEEIEK